MAGTYNNIGLIYYNKGDYDRAMEYYNKSLNIKERIGDEPGMASTYYNIFLIYETKGNINKAIYYLEKCVEIECRIGHPDCEEDKKELEELKKKR